MRSKAQCSRARRDLELKLSSNEAFLLTSESDIRYFSSFYSKGEMMLIAPKHRAVCFIDSMNRSLAEKELEASGIRVVSPKGTILSAMAGLVGEMRIKEIFLDMGSVSASLYRAMRRCLKGIKFSSSIGKNYAREVLNDIRAVKSSEEISLLRFAACETVRIWGNVSLKIKPGMTEIEIARIVDVMVREEGYENSFPTIAATGENTAYPHAIPGKRKLGNKDHVVVDFGIRHELYCSDLTRIWGECRINGQIRDLCENVREVQREAIRLIRPGVSIKRTAEAINSLVTEMGLGSFVMHGLGHGIGLDVHESPSFGVRSLGNFEKGMVLTVEPGFYVPGKGGVRIEDMVLVTPKGREVLTI